MSLFSNRSDYERLAERESELWGQAKADRPTTWFESPLIYRFINKRISGHPDVDCLDHARNLYFKTPAALGLNVGCGHGEHERLIVERGLAERMHGFDISGGAVEIAISNAEKAELADRIEYFTADANRLDQAPLAEQYDVVFAFMALHHFMHLEDALDGLKKRLKPGGLLIANEFIGPYRFQWTDKQLDIANRLLACFPVEMTRNLREPGKFKRKIERPSIAYMKKHMAFESVCTDRIVPALKERFDVIEYKPYGGTILQNLFEAIMGNFDEEFNREHAIMVRMAAVCEEVLLDNGGLEHDHVYIVCKKA